MKIMILEDERIVSAELSISLSRAGYEVASAYTASTGIELGIRWHPTLIISDWNLKCELDGIDVCREVVKVHPDVSLIFMSGRPKESLLEATADLAPLSIIQKPISLDDILVAVEMLEDCPT